MSSKLTALLMFVVLLVMEGTGQEEKAVFKCKYLGKKYDLGSIIKETTADDNCTKAIMQCKKVGRKAKIVLEAINDCVCPNVTSGTSLDDIKSLIELHMEKTDQIDCCCKEETIDGILVAGGLISGSSSFTDVELFIPSTGTSKTCNLMALPEGRTGLTIDTIDNKPVVCGGAGSPKISCIIFEGGSWSNYANPLMFGRWHHSSWISPGGLMLFGGYFSGTTTETVPYVGGKSLEGYTLQSDTRWTCAIPDGNSVILSGGEDPSNNAGRKVVSRYNSQGKVEDMPNLIRGRYAHGCGSYKQSDGSQVYIVAGGFDAGWRLDSTEKMMLGPGNVWTTATPLPYDVHNIHLSSISMNNLVYLIGGSGNGGKNLNGVLTFDGEKWNEVGQLQTARYRHGATTIKIDAAMMEFCK